MCYDINGWHHLTNQTAKLVCNLSSSEIACEGLAYYYSWKSDMISHVIIPVLSGRSLSRCMINGCPYCSLHQSRQLTPLHSEQPELHWVLTILSAIWLTSVSIWLSVCLTYVHPCPLRFSLIIYPQISYRFCVCICTETRSHGINYWQLAIIFVPSASSKNLVKNRYIFLCHHRQVNFCPVSVWALYWQARHYFLVDSFCKILNSHSIKISLSHENDILTYINFGGFGLP